MLISMRSSGDAGTCGIGRAIRVQSDDLLKVETGRSTPHCTGS
jgi:hypothetical protein